LYDLAKGIKESPDSMYIPQRVSVALRATMTGLEGSRAVFSPMAGQAMARLVVVGAVDWLGDLEGEAVVGFLVGEVEGYRMTR
jgi:hypothetical protein